MQVNFGSGGAGLSTESSPNLKEVVEALNTNQKAIVANIALMKAAEDFAACKAVAAPTQIEIEFK